MTKIKAYNEEFKNTLLYIFVALQDKLTAKQKQLNINLAIRQINALPKTPQKTVVVYIETKKLFYKICVANYTQEMICYTKHKGDDFMFKTVHNQQNHFWYNGFEADNKNNLSEFNEQLQLVLKNCLTSEIKISNKE